MRMTVHPAGHRQSSQPGGCWSTRPRRGRVTQHQHQHNRPLPSPASPAPIPQEGRFVPSKSVLLLATTGLNTSLLISFLWAISLLTTQQEGVRLSKSDCYIMSCTVSKLIKSPINKLALSYSRIDAVPEQRRWQYKNNFPLSPGRDYGH